MKWIIELLENLFKNIGKKKPKLNRDKIEEDRKEVDERLEDLN